jgi:16S rRNA (adenine1518-N6/adenine1519-N6)-dimethyltransferase
VSEPQSALLRRRGLHLSRDLGQNFLVDEGTADRLAALAGVSQGDSVIEVGVGLGTLTRALARRGARVVGIEIDAGLVRALEEESLLPEGVELLHTDALRLDWPALIDRLPAPIRVVANLPYSAATPMLRRLIDLRDRLADWSVMVQRELALRMTGRPGSKDYGSLAVLHHLTVDVERVLDLAPARFFPRPKVHSSFVRVWPRRTPLLAPDELPHVERVVRAAFATRRKTILNCLRGAPLGAAADPAALQAALAACGIDPRARAETLTPEQLLALARALARVVD